MFDLLPEVFLLVFGGVTVVVHRSPDLLFYCTFLLLSIIAFIPDKFLEIVANIYYYN